MHVAGHKQRPPLHPQERWFLAIVLLQLVFLPWAFGTMHVWSQATALGLSVLGFVVALWPRTYEGEHAILFSNQQPAVGGQRSFAHNQEPITHNRAGAYRVSAMPRLLRFPLFWLGLILLAYIGLQAWNPSWVWTRNATSWWLVRVNDIEWLPTSIETPFARFNLWRQFIIYATVWLTVCALWIGITRRRTLHILLGILVANACILGVLGFVHKAVKETKVLWLQEFPGAYPFSSFVYQNHAGSYFGFMAFVALGLGVWHFFEGRKRMARSTPAALWLMGAVILGLAVVFSLSRGAILSVTFAGFFSLIAIAILVFTSASRSTVPAVVPLVLAIVVVGTLGWTMSQIDFSEVTGRFERLMELKRDDPSVLGRQLASESAADMLTDHWLRGVGAGGFRYLYPEYIKHKPMIYDRGMFFWEHAHNDWLEIPIEVGLVGVFLLASGVGWIGWTWFRNGGWRHPLVLMIGFGAGQVMIHAVMDFPFQNPAILVTWWALLIISLRWLELERA